MKIYFFYIFLKICKTLERNNKATAKFKATLVSYVFNITIEVKHNLRDNQLF